MYAISDLGVFFPMILKDSDLALLLTFWLMESSFETYKSVNGTLAFENFSTKGFLVEYLETTLIVRYSNC